MDTSVASSDHRPRFQLGRLKLKAHGGLLALPATLWLFLLFLLPLLIVFTISFMERGRGGTVIYDWSLESLRRNFHDNYLYVTTEGYWLIFKRSLNIAFTTTFWCLVLGYPLAFFISTRRKEWVQKFSLFLVILPFWTNFVIRTYAWRVLLGNNDDGLLNHTLLQLGLIEEPLKLMFTTKAVTIGMVYGYLPFMVLPIYAAVERFDFKLVEAAHDLGGNDWTAFWRVIFPLTLPGVIAGSILVFIPAIGTYITAEMLGGTKGMMIGSLIYRNFRGTGDWTRGAATSMVLMAVVAVALVVYALVAQRTENTPSKASAHRSADVLSRAFGLLAAMIAPITGSISRQFLLLSDELNQRRRQKFGLSPALRMKRDLIIRRTAPVLMWANALFCYIFLWVPIIVLLVFSFNDSNSTAVWRGFSTKWYSKLLSGGIDVDADLTTDLLLQSVKVSLIVGVAATLISTIVAVMVSLSMARSRFIGKRPLEGLLYLPVGIPEITQGISLLVFFNIVFDYAAKHLGITLRSGYLTLILSHVAFCIPFVAIVVRARLANMNPHFEEAARDLGANEWRTFWRVTFPLMLPGVVAGALLAFTLSLDDFIISEFTKGLNTSTLTVVVYSMARRTVTPEINAISTMMIIVSTLLVGLSLVLQGRSAGKA